MRTAILVFSLSVAGCASAPPASSPTPLTSAQIDAPDAEHVDAFFKALRANDGAQIEATLARSPKLAEAHNAKGRSAFVVALGRNVGEGFTPPQKNRALAAILARRPTLDAIEAAGAGDLARVDAEIVRDPAYVRRVHAIGWTALHFAAFGGQPRVIERLLAAGAELEARAKNEFANTPLQVGLLTEQVEVTRFLLARGANVNAKQAEGFTALHEAAQAGSAPLVQLLLDAGADPRAKAENGDTPIDTARRAKRDDVVRLLESRTTT